MSGYSGLRFTEIYENLQRQERLTPWIIQKKKELDTKKFLNRPNQMIENFLNSKEVVEILKQGYKLKAKEKELVEEFFVKIGRDTRKYWILALWLKQKIRTSYVERWLKLIPIRQKFEGRILIFGKKEGRKQYLKIYLTKHNVVHYWLNKGYSRQQAEIKVKENMSKPIQISLDKRQTGETLSIWQKEYWIRQGYQEKEAVELAKSHRGTDLSSFIRRHGISEGTIKYEETVKKIKDAYDTKTSEEKADISGRKGHGLKTYIDKFGQEEGTRRYQEYWLNFNFQASKESRKFLDPIYQFCIDLGISPKYGIEGQTELKLYDAQYRRIYSYDFAIESLGLILEYNSDAFHPRKERLKEKWNSWTEPHKGRSAQEKYEYDMQKNEFGRRKGYMVIEIWPESDSKEIIHLIHDLWLKSIIVSSLQPIDQP